LKRVFVSRLEYVLVRSHHLSMRVAVAVGLFFYGVSEPLWHQSSHWYANAGYHTQDEVDMFAINQTLFHWVSSEDHDKYMPNPRDEGLTPL